MRIRYFWLSAILLLVHAADSVTTIAQTSYPMLMSLKPTAAQVGQSSVHTVSSRYTMYGADRVLITGDGVTGEVVTPMKPLKPGQKTPNLTSLKVKFTVAKDAMPGVRDFRIATPTGVSTLGQLVIVRDAVVSEIKSNNTADKAQAVKLPATLCGAIERNEDVDYFKFPAKAGQSFTFLVRSMQLQDRMHDLQRHVDPIISVKNASGSTLAQSDNHFAADPLLTYRFTEDGDYFLEIRDVRYHGNAYWQYCIEATDRPYIAALHPMGVLAGERNAVKLIGRQLPTNNVITYQPNAKSPTGPTTVQLPLGKDMVTNPVTVVVARDAHTVEVAGESDGALKNNTAKTAQPVAVPGGISGRIDFEADIDCFKFSAKKGERLSFEVLARRYGSELDSHLRILDAKTGRQLSLNDDTTRNRRSFSDSAIDNWIAPADGDYVIEVRDLHLRGGDDFVYFVDISRAKPSFDLYLDTDKTQLTPGTSGVIFARVVRRNGFTGEVKLEIDGLPKGVTAVCGRILAGKTTDGCIVLTAAANAPKTAVNIRVKGTAEFRTDNGESRTLESVAIPQQETYMPGGGRSHWQVDMHTVSIAAANDLRSVKLSTEHVTLKPGESKRIDITIERAPGFNKNVTLDMLFRHLSSTYANTLPAGVTIDAKNSKTLLTGKVSKGHITLKAAANATPTDGQLVSVMANISLNFVMKATYSAKPLRVSVTK